MFLAPLLLPLLASSTTAVPAPTPSTVEPITATVSAAAPVPFIQGGKEVRAKFVEFAGKKDHDGLLALWRANPGAVLGTIDADLEGSLKVREKAKDKEPDMAKIAEMHARALWGARIAFEASGDPMILDYASSFVGWNAAQRKQFREGQAASGRAGQALGKKDGAAALAAGTECLEKAMTLGDWWGSAMGLDGICAAQRVLGQNEKALEAAAQAAAIYHSLGLAGDELGASMAMAELCQTLDRPARAQVACDRALALAKAMKNDEAVQQVEALAKKIVSPTTPAK